MRSVTLLDTATASTNLGDQIIMEAVRREIDDVCADAFQYSVVSHEWMGRRSRGLVGRADVSIVGGSNLLSSRMWFKPLWKITPLQALRQSEIVLMGCGWYQDQSPADAYSRWLFRRVLSKRYLHSVRDSQAERMLTAAGVPNVVNTGCPTLWSLSPERCAAIPRAKAGSVVTTLNTYIVNPAADRALLETLREHYSRVFFWTQTREDYEYARQLDPALIFLPPSLSALDQLLETEQDLDYVGNRLHAGIRAMQKGRRTVIVEIDNRARAMSEDFDVPTVAREDTDRLTAMIAQPFRTHIKLPTQAIERWRAQLRPDAPRSAAARAAAARAGARRAAERRRTAVPSSARTRSMITDIRTLPDGAPIDADLCIIGGGAAAIAMALQLSGSRLSVAILESGGLTLDGGTQALASGEQTGIPYFPLDGSRYRLLGGSTFRWGARTAPLKPIDFAPRHWVPASGWPISAATLEPYRDTLFELVGLHRPFSYDADVWRSFQQVPPAIDPEVLEYTAFQFGKHLGLAEVFRKSLEQSPNVTVYLHANALNLQSNERGDQLVRVDVGALAGQRYTVTARRYVLASGGIENARLLLLSNSVNPAGLCNEHDLVGRYFMEHPTVSAGSIVSERWQELADVFSPGLLGGRLVEFGLGLSPALQEREECLNAVVRPTVVVTRDSTQALRELLWLLKHRRLHTEVSAAHDRAWFTERIGAIARDPVRIVSNLLRHAAGKPKRFRIDDFHLQVRTEQEPNRDSRVTLAHSLDAFGQRRAHLHWTMTERDKRTMRIAARSFDAEVRRLGLGRLEMASWLAAEDMSWPADLVGGHHHMGTTRMSSDARTGVVNADCRSHAVSNLFITGSSVFATAGYANPTMTVLGLAVRLAEHLRATS